MDANGNATVVGGHATDRITVKQLSGHYFSNYRNFCVKTH